jgi:hypothetical protein
MNDPKSLITAAAAYVSQSDDPIRALEELSDENGPIDPKLLKSLIADAANYDLAISAARRSVLLSHNIDPDAI